MNYFAGFMTGSIITVMNFLNTKLCGLFGNFIPLIIIHLTGLVLLLPFVIRKGFPKSDLPLWCWTGGLIGILTTLFCNLSYAALGVSLATAFCVMGQVLVSTLFDHFGFLGFHQYKINWKTILSLLLIISGTLVMTIW